VSWLVKKTQPQDWEEGSRPIAWPSSREQEEFLGLEKSQVKFLNRTLFEAGIFVMRDNKQGKRYGRRGHDNRIIEAFDFDLSPLAQRTHEFVRIAGEARAERKRMKDLRRRVTLARRGVRQPDFRSWGSPIVVGRHPPSPGKGCEIVRSCLLLTSS
jgi:replication initiation protein RepC